MDIEDYLELLTGAKPTNSTSNYQFILNKSDVKLLTSLAKQVQKNIGLTDRQFELTKKKLLEYRDDFEKNGFFDLDKDLENLRIELRTINRSKTVQLVLKDYFDLFSVRNKVMIAIRFPYSNKMIKYITFIKDIQERREYDSKSKTHFVEFTEKNVLKIVDKLQDANFEIQKEIIDYYKEIKEFEKSPQKFQPGVYNFELKNIHKNCIDYLVAYLGKPCLQNLALYYDRRDEFGIGHFDETDLRDSLKEYSSLANKIIERRDKQILIDSSKFTFKDVFSAIKELQRLPLLIILKHGHEAENLLEYYQALADKTDLKNISVMFRLENNTEKNIQFNELVKELKINNKVTSTTEVVILNNEKIPKPLLQENWKPNTTLLIDSFRQKKQLTIYYNESSLVINYDDANVSTIRQIHKGLL